MLAVAQQKSSLFVRASLNARVYFLVEHERHRLFLCRGAKKEQQMRFDMHTRTHTLLDACLSWYCFPNDHEEIM